MKEPVKFLSWDKIAFMCFLESSVTFFVKTNKAINEVGRREKGEGEEGGGRGGRERGEKAKK